MGLAGLSDVFLFQKSLHFSFLFTSAGAGFGLVARLQEAWLLVAGVHL